MVCSCYPSPVPLPIDRLFSLIDFLGVFVGALGGALAAVRDTRYRFDLVGVIGLALASALGGGITRDLILQQGPPLAFADPRYLLTAFAGQAAVAIENARLFQMTDQALASRVQQLDNMQRIDQELNRTLDLQRVVELTIDNAMRETRHNRN